MKKNICILVIAFIFLLSGCGRPVKKITPDQNSNVTENNQQSSQTTQPEVKSEAKPEVKPETKQNTSTSQPSTGTAKGSTGKVSEAALSSDLVMTNGIPTVKNTKNILVLVNKSRNLPSNYVPDDLKVPNVKFSFEGDSPKKKMREEAAKALEDLFNAGLKGNIKLAGVSGYRSFATQKTLFNNEVNRYGETAARKSVAYPGQSEHQTGLSIDVSCSSEGYQLNEAFGETKEGKWLKENAPSYGFIIRYPRDKEDITGYIYEPWHIRYVGKEAAKYITANDIVLDEYYDKIVKK